MNHGRQNACGQSPRTYHRLAAAHAPPDQSAHGERGAYALPGQTLTALHWPIQQGACVRRVYVPIASRTIPPLRTAPRRYSYVHLDGRAVLPHRRRTCGPPRLPRSIHTRIHMGEALSHLRRAIGTRRRRRGRRHERLTCRRMRRERQLHRPEFQWLPPIHAESTGCKKLGARLASVSYTYHRRSGRFSRDA